MRKASRLSARLTRGPRQPDQRQPFSADRRRRDGAQTRRIPRLPDKRRSRKTFRRGSSGRESKRTDGASRAARPAWSGTRIEPRRQPRPRAASATRRGRSWRTRPDSRCGNRSFRLAVSGSPGGQLDPDRPALGNSVMPLSANTNVVRSDTTRRKRRQVGRRDNRANRNARLMTVRRQSAGSITALRRRVHSRAGPSPDRR